MGANRERFERELHRLRGYRLVYDRARALKIEEHYDFTQWEKDRTLFDIVRSYIRFGVADRNVRW
jgi:hypothetical protein